MTDTRPGAGRGRLWLIFGPLLVASFVPLLVLDLDQASQLASALALPLAVLLAALTSTPVARESTYPIPWRRYLTIGSIIVAIVGVSGVGFAFWQNTKDVRVTLSGDGQAGAHWSDGSSLLLSIPGSPPQRGHLTIAVSLKNVNQTGDCEHTGIVEFVPVIDGNLRPAVTGRPGQDVELSLAGVVHEAKVRVTLGYEPGNEKCVVDLYIDKAVLHD